MNVRMLLTTAMVVWLIPGLLAAQKVTKPSLQTLDGEWSAAIVCPGGEISFGLELDTKKSTAVLVNGSERISIPMVHMADDAVALNLPHYDSQVFLNVVGPKELKGTWQKQKGPDEVLKMSVVARRSSVEAVPPESETKTNELHRSVLGRWQVQFESSEDPAVGVFQGSGSTVEGTFLTTTGDYRFLAGSVTEVEGKAVLQLSCFDGAHAFLFRATLVSEGELKGEFWSSDSWHEAWTAQRDPTAQLPDDFQQTRPKPFTDWASLQFPDLDGKRTSVTDAKFQGPVKIVYIFGSWCPNCHDAARLLSQLDKKYGKQGLSILGLAFELTGDPKRDADQVRRYLKRHDCTYPVLLAGKADKQEASRVLPMMDRLRSFPTTLFLDADHRIIAIHTGFTGPATGESYEKLKARFEQIIEKQLR